MRFTVAYYFLQIQFFCVVVVAYRYFSSLNSSSPSLASFGVQFAQCSFESVNSSVNMAFRSAMNKINMHILYEFFCFFFS